MSKDNIIVVRRKGRRSERRHGGSWKIAYADFMTAMMAFFLVMWILTLVPREELKEIADYFRMPLMEAITGGARSEFSHSVIPGGDPSIVPQSYPSGGQDGEHPRDMERLEDLKYELEALIQSDPDLKQFHPQLLLNMTEDGLQIQIIDKQNQPMFAMGSASVLPYMRTILRAISGLLNEMPNRIRIVGHTDSVQYATGEREYSNWELSADRANAARKELVVGGLSEDKVKQIIGLSSTVSLVKEDPAAAVNRRISITVLSKAAEQRIDAENEAALTDQELELLRQDTSLYEPPHIEDSTAMPEPDDASHTTTPADSDADQGEGTNLTSSP
ncbi:MAG TPA: flagellar motor protein MotB [Paenalcaligenes hominis]|uniref:Chemotaxis protein MotB n=2 Tax=Paenalcaligenes hominis TaxID=643674 RepID=A0A9D2VH44_9BURK|nr:flagellar motor protein MotB [Paenalcaligenes hominis]NJB65989.1 chemotaxis protein MotB [Paenalcaligenes hominis]GGE71228.1 chemotaxis protein MotB [Paenalcaligenes hominis]HJH24596.1 flagellar motor protein MotB [Paenalcaligenes hominis]